jgi:diaminopimelate epimerase
VLSRRLYFFEVNMGNPHAVFFPIEDLSKVLLEVWGPSIEFHSRFINRTNVELVKATGPQSIDVRIWERGTGMTLACGTGACASAVTAIATGRVKSPVSVRLPGGELKIKWKGPGQAVLMEGPAEEVFRGNFFY